MYQINLTLIEDFLNKMTGGQNEKKITLVDFFVMIEESVTLKKILFRQNHLSDMVDHQNKTKYRQLFEDSEKKHRSPQTKTSYGTRKFSTGSFYQRK